MSNAPADRAAITSADRSTHYAAEHVSNKPADNASFLVSVWAASVLALEATERATEQTAREQPYLATDWRTVTSAGDQAVIAADDAASE